MQLYPAIDLMSGQAVRLRQGRAEDKTVYSDDPVAVAREWEARGGDWLHVVDLDAAFSGEQSNLEVVRRMASALRIPVQLGGGIRDEAAIERALGAGVSRVVIGTRAAEADDFVARMVGKFGSERIAVGIDARDGFVAVRGWTESTQLARRSSLPARRKPVLVRSFTLTSPRMECCKVLIFRRLRLWWSRSVCRSSRAVEFLQPRTFVLWTASRGWLEPSLARRSSMD